LSPRKPLKRQNSPLAQRPKQVKLGPAKKNTYVQFLTEF
jgi:hypothetical protein